MAIYCPQPVACDNTAPTHPSLFLIVKGVLATLVNDSGVVLDMPVFHHSLLFKHETARERGSTFKILQKHLHPEGRYTPCRLDSLWITAVCTSGNPDAPPDPYPDPQQIHNRSA